MNSTTPAKYEMDFEMEKWMALEFDIGCYREAWHSNNPDTRYHALASRSLSPVADKIHYDVCGKSWQLTKFSKVFRSSFQTSFVGIATNTITKTADFPMGFFQIKGTEDCRAMDGRLAKTCEILEFIPDEDVADDDSPQQRLDF